MTDSLRPVLLSGGNLLDGTGAAPRRVDLLLQGDRIAAIAPGLQAPGAQVLDCSGMTLAPGFIDVHTHDDAQVLLNPGMLAKVSQGVTTVITGNCGLSLVPLVTETPPSPLDLLHTTQFRFPSLAHYVQALRDRAPAVNVAALIGHTTLRFAVMEHMDRPATPQETQAMTKLLELAMSDGALGLSSGVFYAPALAADPAELTALTQVAARHGGVYVTHIRSEMDVIIQAIQEAADAALAGPLPLVLSHHKCAGPRNWGRTIETLAMIERLNTRQNVHLDVYPYTAGSTLLKEDLVDGVIEILITRSDPHPEMAGRYLADIARDWGLDQLQACRRLMPGGACYFQMREDDVRRVMSHPLSMIGSDGLPHDDRPHPRLWGTFPRVLGHYSRDQGLLSLPEAIHKMTGLSARNFGLRDRGELRVGAFADVVVFDAATIQDRATYADPHQMSQGIERVYVNGQCAFSREDGALSRSGRFLRR